MSKSRDIADSAATINYIDGLTSDAQSQLNDKATLDGSPTFTGTVTATAFSGDGSGLTGVDSLPSQTGNNGLFLTTDGSTASWAEAGGGAMELISTTTVSGTPSTIDITSGFSSTYDDYVIYGSNITASANAVGDVQLYLNGVLDSGTNYFYTRSNGTAFSSVSSQEGVEWGFIEASNASGFKIEIFSANSTAAYCPVINTFGRSRVGFMGRTSSSGAITGIRLLIPPTTFTSGTIRLYGIKKA